MSEVIVDVLSYGREKKVDAKPARVQIDEVADKAISWLLDSGIQFNSQSPETDGGFASWYEQDTESSPYLYAEITGYMLTLLTWLNSRKQDVRLLKSAIRAADWLIEISHKASGGFPCLVPLRPNRFEHKRDYIYTFDCGIILSGLVNLHRATGIPRFLSAAVTVADWMLRDLLEDTGALKPIYNAATGDWIYSDAEWSLCSGSYHTKVAIGLINLYDATKLPKYLNAATRICDFALAFQESNGRFVTFPESGGTNSHPHAYAAEGHFLDALICARAIHELK